MNDLAETRAIAIATMVLTYALADVLKRTSKLDTEAVESTLEASLTGVENAFSPDDRAAAMARQLLDLMGNQLQTHVAPQGV
jgi:hypothetical protein